MSTTAVEDARLLVADWFVRALHGGRADDAATVVSPSVPAEAMTGERLAQVWSQLTARFGELTELRPAGVTSDGDRHEANLAARFARSEVTIRVVLDARSQVIGFWVSEPRPPAYEPPPYVDPATFTEHEVRVGDGPQSLPGSLTLPAADGRHPGVVLVHGSGPNDRDETLGANRPFRDLAWGLASRGVAVLRYDKRTFVHPRQFAVAEWDVEREVVADALDALALLRARPEIDPARLVVAGHSLGAGFAPAIASRDGRVAGVVMLAAAARPIADVLVEQIAWLDELQANPATADERDALLEQIRQVGRGELPPDTNLLGVPASYWYELASHDVLDTARTSTVPALVLQGGRDYQVTDRDLALWREAFSGNARATLKLYPELNHLFMTGRGKSTPAEYTNQTGHVAEQVVADVARFVTELP